MDVPTSLNYHTIQEKAEELCQEAMRAGVMISVILVHEIKGGRLHLRSVNSILDQELLDQVLQVAQGLVQPSGREPNPN